MSTTSPTIRLRDVRKSFSGLPVLDGCDFDAAPGTIHGLVGTGGAGKTTLLKVIASLLAPDLGEVSVHGAPIPFGDEDGLRAYRAGIGMQFQNIALFDFLSVADNVRFPLVAGGLSPDSPDVCRRVDEALVSVGLSAAADRRPSELSGGMQRRVAIARAVVADAPILLFDDPTGGLDPVTSSRIFELIGRAGARADRTTIVASQDIDRMVRHCATFSVMDGGRVVFTGTPSEAGSCGLPGVRALFEGVEAADGD